MPSNRAQKSVLAQNSVLAQRFTFDRPPFAPGLCAGSPPPRAHGRTSASEPAFSPGSHPAGASIPRTLPDGMVVDMVSGATICGALGQSDIGQGDSGAYGTEQPVAVPGSASGAAASADRPVFTFLDAAAWCDPPDDNTATASLAGAAAGKGRLQTVTLSDRTELTFASASWPARHPLA